MKYLVRALKENDVDAISQLHLEAFQSFFLTSLGKSFLKCFYKSIIKSKNGIAIGLFNENDKKLICFAIGTSKSKSFYKKIIKENGIKLFLSGFIPLITHPSRLIRIFRSIAAPVKSNYNDSGTLLSICTAKAYQGAGLGKIALKEFEQQLYFLKVSTIILTTDADNNKGGNAFYTNNGYKLTEQFLQNKNRLMNLYVKLIE